MRTLHSRASIHNAHTANIQTSKALTRSITSESPVRSRECRAPVMATDLQAFLPLDAQHDQNPALKKKAKKLRKQQQKQRTLAVSANLSREKSDTVFIGRIPHGFYEEQMRGFFSQFGNIKRLRISRNKKTGNSQHYGYIQFESPEVAEIVADSMNNYLLFERVLQVRLVPPARLHNRLWIGANRVYKLPDRMQLAKKSQNKEVGPKEQQQMLKNMTRREKKRRNKIKSAGIDYEYPDLVRSLPAAPKKIKFSEDTEEAI